MLNMNCYRKLLVTLIIMPIITLAFGLHNQEQCLAKENAPYQGKAFFLYGKVISDSEFQQYIELASKQANQLSKSGRKFSKPQIWDYALTMAINNLAFQKEMSKHESEISVTKEEAEAFIDKFCQTEEDLESALTLNGFENKATFIDAVVQEMEYEKFFLLKAREFKMEVKEAEVRAELEQIKVRHILIGFKDSGGKILRTSDQALARADEVYRKVMAGGDFGQLVIEYSDDPGTRKTGGDLGTMSLADFVGNMVGEFVEGALALGEGEISKPVKSQFGYHIIRLDKREMPEGDQYLTGYKEAEERLLVSKVRKSPELKAWFTKLFEDAAKEMFIHDPALQAYRLSKQEKWAEAAKYYKNALKNKYYAEEWDVYLDAANVYLMLKQPAKALKMLKKVPVEAQNTSEYQDMLKRVQSFKAE